LPFKYTSVRITGTILTHDYDNGFITIGDPLLLLQHKSYSRNHVSSGAGKRNLTKNQPFAAKRAQAAQHLHQATTKINPYNNKNNNGNQNQYKRTGFVGGNRGPLVSKRRKAPLQSSSSSSTCTGSTNKSSSDEHAHREQTTSPTTTMPIVVHVDVRAVVPIHCKIGDLIMCIGELRSIRNGVSTDIPTALEKACNDASSIGYLQARIARNKNGLDVHLQHRALLLKREYLMERQSVIAACNDDVEMAADRDDIDDENMSAQKDTTEELSSTVYTDTADAGENKANIGGRMGALEICPPSHGRTGAENEAPEKNDGI